MPEPSLLFPSLVEHPDRAALTFDERTLRYGELAAIAGAHARELLHGERVAVWATPRVETPVAVVAALLAGATCVPLNAKLGRRELAHILADSAPRALLAAPDERLPDTLADLPRVDVRLDRTAPAELPAEPDPEQPALILYTSGTTGPPKGAVLPRRALRSNTDALAEAWEWTDRDVVVHALPLFHAHGMVVGTIGTLRRGGELRYVRPFSPDGIAAALRAGGTMLFAVPTMYHRLAEAAERDPAVADALRGARLLASGSAPLARQDQRRIEAATGQRIVERYGLTETLMLCGARASGSRTQGFVGPPLDGVELRLLDERGDPIGARDDATVGEIAVRGDSLFLGYLNRPDATAAAVRDGWFHTGDLATRAADGALRILGRSSTDLIKTGGYKVGAGEVEACLLDHAAVAEAAVTGEPDDDLGERIVAWVVPADAAAPPAERALADHVAEQLTPHKRPRRVRVLDALPRNEMGKVVKGALGSKPPERRPGATTSATHET